MLRCISATNLIAFSVFGDIAVNLLLIRRQQPISAKTDHITGTFTIKFTIIRFLKQLEVEIKLISK